VRPQRLFLYVWALPTTAVGLVFVGVGLFGGRVRIVDGVIEVQGGAVEWFLRRCTGLVFKGGASAMTLGHVVLGRDGRTLELTRQHERVHVRQCERWGPLFLPAYGVASLVAHLRGGSAYRDNRFEKEAYDLCSGQVRPDQ